MRNQLMTILVLAGLFLAFSLSPAAYSGAAPSPSVRPAAEPPNIILIFLDSLRADHLGCYGYGRATSPFIDSLAHRGVRVRNVIPPASGTFPSVHSILTSRVPSRFFLNPRCSLPETELTLAEILQAWGWKTAGFSSNPLISGRSESGHYAGGFEQGFDLFDDTNPAGRKWGWESKTSEGIINKALGWLEINSRERFFLFLYIMDPHDRYHSPEPFNSLFDPDYQGRKMVAKGDATHYERRILRGQDSRLQEADVRHLEALYDGEIAYADNQIGRLLSALKNLKIDKKTMIVVTSDHGEEFFEHGGLKHGYTLHRELLEVPLIITWSGVLPAGVTSADRLVPGISVVPTILDLVGVPIPKVMEGSSIKSNWFLAGDPGDFVLSEAPFIDAKALITPEWKYIHYFETDLLHSHLSPKYAQGRGLYNRKQDPGEKNNLVEKYPEIAARMLELMLQNIPPEELERVVGKRAIRLDDSSLKQLKSLGYLN